MATLFFNRSGYTLPAKPVKAAQPTVNGVRIRDLTNLLRLLKESGLADVYRPYQAGKPGAPVANNQVDDAPVGYRPYQAPKPGKSSVTVAKPDRASNGGGVDAELAAAGWRPYRDPRKA